MKTTRKLLAVLMALTLVFGAACAAAAAGTYDTADAAVFTFTDSGITASGNTAGVKISGTGLTIQSAGTYVVQGSCSDGSITVKKGVTDVVLILNGLTLTSSDTAPITCNKSSGVTIMAAEGTVSTLTDSAYNNDDTYPENENAENAVIKCKDGSDVTLCGAGTLRIVANGKNGVKSGASTETEGEAHLTVRDLTLEVTANVNDAINAEAALDILSGAITIDAADDAIHSDYVLNIGAEGTDGRTILVQSSTEGIEAATLNVYSGDVTVHAADDGMNAANSDLSGYDFSLNLYGGNLVIDAGGDGLDTNGKLNLAGANVQVFSSSRSDNSPLDSDGSITLTGGTVLAVGMGGMAQTPNSASQSYVTFGGGMGGFGGGMGGRTFAAAPEDEAEPQVLVQNRGGRMFGGMGNMGGQAPGGNMGGFGGEQGGSAVSIAAGDTVAVADSSGKILCSAAAVREAGYVFFTSPELKDGETYTLLVNGSTAATATASTQGGMSGFGGMGDRMPGNQQNAAQTPGQVPDRMDGERRQGGQIPGGRNEQVQPAQASDLPADGMSPQPGGIQPPFGNCSSDRSSGGFFPGNGQIPGDRPPEPPFGGAAPRILR